MSKTLIITDKRETANILVSALMRPGEHSEEAGYSEDGRHIIYCSEGDLMRICAIDEYVPGRVEMNHLPILPERIRYQAIPDRKTRLKEIKYLFTRTDVHKIITATESTHIGEVRAATIFLACGMDPYGPNNFRLWSSKPLVPENVEEELANAKPAASFKNIYEVSQAQIITDWIFTENISKALSLALKSRHKITRPQAYVLSLLALNREERALFRPKLYRVVKARFASISRGDEKFPWTAEFQDEKFLKEGDATEFANKIKGEHGAVTIQKSKDRQKAPPKLFNLADLQAEAQKRHNLSAEETLTAALSCHNCLKCISSPLTNARLLPETEITALLKAISALQSEYSDFFTQVDQRGLSVRNKRIFTVKTDRHHAIMPIATLPEGAGENETVVYGLILRRFAASLSLPSAYTDIETEVTVNGNKFICSESIVTKTGWQFLFGKTDDERRTPDLSEGQPVKVVDTEVCDRKTTPPPELTDASLIRILSAPARKIKDIRDDVFTIRPQDINIGTNSVRGKIIEDLIQNNYVERSKKRLTLTDKGLFIIDIISRLPATKKLVSHKEIAKWEMRLSSIAKGTLSKSRFIDDVKESIADAVKEYRPGIFERLTSKKLDGKCPLCGGDVYEKDGFYGCGNWRDPHRCKFRIWRRHGGRTIGKKHAEQLITGRRTEIIEGFISSGLKRKEFSAHLVLEINNGSARVTYDFPKEEAIGEIGSCPDCRGNVYEYSTRYACENSTTGGGCGFQIGKTIKSKTIDTEQARRLLTVGNTGKLFGFVSRKNGFPKQYSAALSLKKGSPSKVIFDFNQP